MKRILLASTAIVAFAGAAAADGHAGITFSGSASLGYNDTVATGGGDNEFGLYSDLDITANFSAELDNGLTVGASYNLDNLVSNPGSNNGLDYELSLTSETAGLYYGDTAFAAETHWASAGDMTGDGFSEADGETALRGDVTFGGVSASISYADRDANGLGSPTGDLEQLSIGASADFGNINVTMGYQEAAVTVFTGNGDFNQNEVFGISAGTTFGGADVRLAYAESAGVDSLGLSVSYPFGPVTVDASFAANSDGDRWNIAATYADGPISVKLDTDENSSWGLEGSYDVGNGLTVFAGLDDAGDDIYVGGEYDLGGGASLLVSYADDSDADNGDDEIGANC